MRDEIKEFSNSLAKGLTKAHLNILDIGSAHGGDCHCDTCLCWWAICGPNGGEPGVYGPFTKEQVNKKQREMGEVETE